PATGRGCGRDRCQKNRLGLGVTTQPSPDIGRRSSRRKWRFSPGTSPAPISLLRPPFLAIKGTKESRMSVWSAIRTTLSTSPDLDSLRVPPSESRTWRRLSGVSTGPIRGVGCTGVEILGNVQFIGETLPKFRQKVSVFSKWARHRGDVRNFKGFVPGFGKIRGGSFQF
ncbi:Leucine-rich repeat family protein, partial [Prunus dulcis]